jgi:tetratricopeptide (TPR) repeat protein
MLLGILILTAIVYSQALNSSFVLGWDDQDQIVNNQDIKALSFKNIKTIFSDYYVGMYQPLATLSYALDLKASGMDASAFHRTNLILHFVNILLVFVLLFRFTKQADISIIVTALFAIHPMNVESVVWLSTRSNLLYALFYLISLISYLKYLNTKEVRFLIWTFIFFVLSLFSKAPAVTLPFILILLDLFSARKLNLKVWGEKIAFFILSIFFIIIAFYGRFQASHISSFEDTFNYFERFILVGYSFVFYLFHLFFPINLSAIHYYPAIKSSDFLFGIGSFYYLTAFVFIIILGFTVFLLVKSIINKKFEHPILFGIGFFVLSISVMIRFIPLGLQIVTERYGYIPYLGLFFIIAYYYIAFTNSAKIKRFSAFFHAMLLIIILGFSYISYNQVLKWKNTDTLMTQVIKQEPAVWLAYVVRGDGFYLTNQYDKALDDYAIAVSINPKVVSIYVNRANVYAARKEYQKALNELNIAIKIKTEKPRVQTFFNRGLALFNLKRYQEAIDDFNRAISIQDDYALAYLYRGISKGILNQVDKAMQDLEKAVQLDPYNEKAFFSLGVAKSKLKKYPEAISLFTQAISLKHDYSDAYLQRGIAYLMQQNLKESCQDFHKAKQYGNPLAIGFINKYCK